MSKAIRRIQSAALNPNVVGTIHFLLTKAPARIREPLVNFLTTRFGEVATERLIKVLGWLTALAIAKKVNERLNDWALSNWQWKPKKDDWTWSWEIAVVTGGCSGIGKEIVKGLIERDVKVVIFDIQPLPEEFAKKRRITYVKCDVTSPAAIAEAAKFVRTELGDPTILVNNAGVGAPHSILDASNEWITKIFQINIISHFWMTKEFLPHMIKKNKGHIVGLASLASFVAPPSIVDYASTKAAVMAFHEGLGQEIKHVYKAPGVLNTVIHPGWTRTPLVGGYESHLEKTQGKLMEPSLIGKKVCNAIFSCRGGQVIIPSGLSAAAGIRGHPNWLQEVIRDFAVGRAGSDFPKAST